MGGWEGKKVDIPIIDNDINDIVPTPQKEVFLNFIFETSPNSVMSSDLWRQELSQLELSTLEWEWNISPPPATTDYH